jgi:hypothetical protein
MPESTSAGTAIDEGAGRGPHAIDRNGVCHSVFAGYYFPDRRFQIDTSSGADQNETGFQQLQQMITASFTENYQNKHCETD